MINTKPSLEDLNKMNQGNMGEHLNIEYTSIGEDHLEGSMPVDERTKQPYGLLHGGASAVLAETLGSLAANLCVDPEKYFCVGIELNSSHLKSVRKGKVIGRAQAIRVGKSIQVWEIKIRNENNDLINISRLTVAVVKK